MGRGQQRGRGRGRGRGGAGRKVRGRVAWDKESAPPWREEGAGES